MIVLALISILTAVGFVLARDIIPQYALDFENFVSQCRTTAISTGRQCRILMVTYDSDLSSLSSNSGKYLVQSAISGGGWDTLPIDTTTDSIDDQKGTGTIDLSTGATKLRHVAIDNWGTIGGPGVSNNNAIVFDSRGFVANPATDFTNGQITITFVDKVAENRGSSNKWAVHITRAGLAKIDSSRRVTDDNIGTSGTATGTSYDADGVFGSP
ncbi:MAG: hypothetical protein GXP62_12455 [Oligoflexia bacterium]|nr:hypothetical protein [Oligoflexia bacterium]